MSTIEERADMVLMYGECLSIFNAHVSCMLRDTRSGSNRREKLFYKLCKNCDNGRVWCPHTKDVDQHNVDRQQPTRKTILQAVQKLRQRKSVGPTYEGRGPTRRRRNIPTEE